LAVRPRAVFRRTSPKKIVSRTDCSRLQSTAVQCQKVQKNLTFQLLHPDGVLSTRRKIFFKHWRNHAIMKYDDRWERAGMLCGREVSAPEGVFFSSVISARVCTSDCSRLQSTAVRTQSTKIMDWTDYIYAVRPNGRTGPDLGSPSSPDCSLDRTMSNTDCGRPGNRASVPSWGLPGTGRDLSGNPQDGRMPYKARIRLGHVCSLGKKWCHMTV